MYQSSADRTQAFMIVIVCVHGSREVEDLKNRANREEIEPIVQRTNQGQNNNFIETKPGRDEGKNHSQI